jgi:hypothetical protein
MVKDLVTVTAVMTERSWPAKPDGNVLTFRGKDRRTALRRAIKAGADVCLPYRRIYSVCAGGARHIRKSIKRELARRARHNGEVFPKCLYWKLT